MSIKFPPSPRSGNIVFTAKKVHKAFGEKVILQEVNMTLEKGEKVAFVGRNGEGKSTFSKIITGEYDYLGDFKLGHNVSIGYFAQNQDELMDENITIFDTIDNIAVGDIRTKIRDLLGSFLFRGEDVDKKVKILSGGERSRLAMVKLLLQPVNLLVLDEPTNHLDIRSKELLKQALINYDGTIVIVSHDREFLNGLVTKVFEFRHHQVKEHIGGIYEFLEKRKLENLSELERKIKSQTNTGNKEESTNKTDYLEKKEMDKVIRKVCQQITASEEKIAKYEAELTSMNELLSNPDKIEKGTEETLFRRHSEIGKTIETEMLFWETLNADLEKLKEQRF